MKRERQEQGAGFAPVGGAQFTPGPWVAERDTARNAYAWKVTGAKGTVNDIARLALVDSYSQLEGNAHLIAAAPAMYEALSELVKYLREEVADEALDTWAPVFKAAMALAQAEGRQG